MAVKEKTPEQEEAEKTTAFEKWLSAPMTRMGMATIPAGEHQDALRLLLRSAFDAGHSSGVGNVLVHVIGAMLARDDKRDGI